MVSVKSLDGSASFPAPADGAEHPSRPESVDAARPTAPPRAVRDDEERPPPYLGPERRSGADRRKLQRRKAGQDPFLDTRLGGERRKGERRREPPPASPAEEEEEGGPPPRGLDTYV
jgi:hypothetical protein